MHSADEKMCPNCEIPFSPIEPTRPGHSNALRINGMKTQGLALIVHASMPVRYPSLAGRESEKCKEFSRRRTPFCICRVSGVYCFVCLLLIFAATATPARASAAPRRRIRTRRHGEDFQSENVDRRKYLAMPKSQFEFRS